MKSKVTINETLVEVDSHHHTTHSTEISFLDFTAFFFPNLLLITRSNPYPSEYWILLDKRYLTNANTTSIHCVPWSSITTIEHALRYELFQSMYKILEEHGIPINETNCALFLFSIFTWVNTIQTSEFTNHDNQWGSLEKNVIDFTVCFPEHCKNGEALLLSCKKIILLCYEKKFDVVDPFKVTSVIKKFAITV